MRDKEFKEDEEHLIDIFYVKVCDTILLIEDYI